MQRNQGQDTSIFSFQLIFFHDLNTALSMIIRNKSVNFRSNFLSQWHWLLGGIQSNFRLTVHGAVPDQMMYRTRWCSHYNLGYSLPGLQKYVTAHGNAVLSVDFSCDGQQIISGSADKTIKILDARSEYLLKTITDIKKHFCNYYTKKEIAIKFHRFHFFLISHYPFYGKTFWRRCLFQWY